MNKNNIHPKLTLVGAGPGDPDLISVKGAKALADADVVLYDALIHPDLLQYAPDSAKKVFVGKRAGSHYYKQNQINQLIVDYALNFGHVVRLKGGDPFVFGRGHEEILYAEAFNIETAVVPGITSAVSVPELQRIPLTRRGASESFWVITGTTKTGEVSKDVALAAQSSATVVILMGLRKLEKIAETFSEHGKANTSVAVIENGTLANEKIVLGKISNIHEKVNAASLKGPAVILIGSVVDLHPELNAEYIFNNYLKAGNEKKENSSSPKQGE